MIGTLVFNIIAVFFAWLESKGLYKHGLKVSFFTVFCFLALRYDFGNDYMAYLEKFEFINSFSNFNIDEFKIKGTELGWIYLNWIFGPTGFFSLVATLAALNTFILYKFVKKYVPSIFYWFAIFLYTFQPDSMLILSSSMRQSIGVMLFLFAIDFLLEKKFLKYSLTIILASLFHTSAIVLLPLVFLSYFNWKVKFSHIFIVLSLFIIPIIYRFNLFYQINIFISQYFDFYSVYTNEGIREISPGLGFALNILIYMIFIYYARNDSSNTHNTLYKIAIISLLLIPISFTISLITRINFYFLPVMMAVFPIAFNRIKEQYIKTAYISVIILFTLYQFFMFFQSDVWKDAFGEYNTIFSAPYFI